MISLLTALLLSAPPTTVDGDGCVRVETLTSELDALLPQLGSDSPLAISVRVRADGSGHTLWLRLVLLDTEELLAREFSATTADCPSMAALLARVVARRLDELPRERWDRPRPRVEPRLVRLGGGVGLSLGLDAGELAGFAELRVGILLARPLWLEFAVQGGLSEPLPIGDAHARVFPLTAEASVGWAIPALGAVFMPHAGLRGGALFARGEGFDVAEVAVFPALAGRVGVTFQGPFNLELAMGVDVELLRTRLVAGPDSRLLPQFRYFVRLGFSGLVRN